MANLDSRIEVRMTKDEKKELQRRAKAANMDVSEYARRRLLADAARSVQVGVAKTGSP